MHFKATLENTLCYIALCSFGVFLEQVIHKFLFTEQAISSLLFYNVVFDFFPGLTLCIISRHLPTYVSKV
jgi:hypothetical protein